jgi:thiamine biosynthesis protein ThiS
MLTIADKTFSSRLIMGTALYPSPEIARFWELIKSLGVHVLPSKAGCKTLNETVSIAALLERRGQKAGVAIAVNGEFVPKSQHTSRIVRDGEDIEIVALMEGG